MFGVIYKITNTANGKIYIGLTTRSINARWNSHVCDAYNKRDYHNRFHNAIRKYGKETFTKEIIDTANTSEELKQKEIFYIEQYHCLDPEIGYNSKPGGEGVGWHHTEEAKKKISAAGKNKPKSEKTRERMKAAQQKLALTKHIIPSIETRQKMSKSHTGHKTTFETRLKISKTNAGKKRTLEMNQKNSDRQKGKKWVHNDELKLNLMAFKQELDQVLSKNWVPGKIEVYPVIPHREFVKKFNL